ncbi:hypothetical protein LCGC14_1162030 [marine sediment metagenome]|uniref:Uncharacterized protein n=1 Tax=marine sediment metagenome TaxID=412755 RepID=A0A0F9LXD4_9ZZZZ
MLSSNESWDVFQKDPSWLDLSNNAKGVWPEVSLVIRAELLSGHAEGLTRKPRRDDIHASSPGLPVEGPDVIPDRGVIEELVCDSGFDDLDAVGVSLDVADDSMSEEPAGSEESAACSGK